MKYLVSLVIIILAVIFAVASQASPENIGINLGEKFNKETFKYKYIGTINDEKSEIDLYVFEFDKSIDKKIFVGVLKNTKVLMFYFFHPHKMNKEYVERNFGKNYQKINDSIIYLNGVFFEFNDKNEVITVGRFLQMKDI